jgi:hypothetical protein
MWSVAHLHSRGTASVYSDTFAATDYRSALHNCFNLIPVTGRQEVDVYLVFYMPVAIFGLMIT